LEKAIRILSTKKLQPNQKQFLLNADFRLIEADFIQIEFQPFQLNSSFDYLIFTSQNAVLSVLKNENNSFLKDKFCFCVGIKTKHLLEENGFKVEKAVEYAEDLVVFLVENHFDKEFTFFSGNLRKDTIPTTFQKHNIIFQEIEVYTTVLTPHKIGYKPDGILFFSPSAVQSYLKENNISSEVCFCIGTTTAAEIKKDIKNIVIANQPTVENVIIQCINYFKNPISDKILSV
jgi:uroporphyrinogen-III synthase